MKSVTGVEGGGGKTGDLVISWDPLPPQEHNAPGVYYRYNDYKWVIETLLAIYLL